MMRTVNVNMLVQLGVPESIAEQHAILGTLMPLYKIDKPLRMAHFLAQILHESALMKHTEENLNYSADRLMAVFPRYFTRETAQYFNRNPQKIANRVYGGRMGNGPEESGDGWKFRGRGFIMLTGRENYAKFGDWVKSDVVENPDPVSSELASLSAIWFWLMHDLNDLSDQDDVRKITKKINGGYNGLDDRLALLEKAKSILNIG